MVATPTVKTSQGDVTVVQQATAGQEKVSQADVVAVYNYPAQSVRTSQTDTLYLSTQVAKYERVSQADIIYVARGRVSDPAVRAWTYTIDGHDFYVLRLGNIETLVYDFHAEQWYVFGSNTSDIWRAFTGANWVGGNNLAQDYGTSNVVVGDDGNGSLYFLDPERSTDDDPVSGSDYPRTFTREVYGQIATRSIDYIPCYGVQLVGSIGEQDDASLVQITLSTSDDQGHNYVSHGTISTTVGLYDVRVEWRSLGQFKAPGRLFRIVDDGALHRIDYLEMIEPRGRG